MASVETALIAENCESFSPIRFLIQLMMQQNASRFHIIFFQTNTISSSSSLAESITECFKFILSSNQLYLPIFIHNYNNIDDPPSLPDYHEENYEKIVMEMHSKELLRTFQQFGDKAPIVLLVMPETVNMTITTAFKFTSYGIREEASFFILTETTSNITLGIVHFEELDIENPAFISKVIFLDIEVDENEEDYKDMTISVGILCYLCPLSERLLPIPEFSHITTSIEESYKSVNWKGYGHVAEINDYRSKQHTLNCESISYFQRHVECVDKQIILSIIISALNITRGVGEGGFSDILTGSPKFSMCPDCAYPPVGAFTGVAIHAVLNNYRFEKLYYCREKIDHSIKKWTLFFDPMDKVVWICLCIVAAVVGIINRDIHSAFHVFFLLLGQNATISCSKSKRNTFTAPVLLVIILSYFYQCILTTNVVAPLPLSVFKTNKELLDQGYKIMVPVSGSIFIIRNNYGKHMKKSFGIDLQRNHFIVHKKSPMWGKFPQRDVLKPLAHLKGTGMLADHFAKVIFRTQHVGLRRSKSTVVCSAVKEVLGSSMSLTFFKLYLAEKALITYFGIFAAGVDNFWKQLYTFQMILETQFFADKCTGDEECAGVGKLSLYSPYLNMAFTLHAVMLLLAILCWLLEGFWYKVFQRTAHVTILSEDTEDNEILW
ncbi:unnamed protein product [Orchesella dallaii]|uniref:Uncharacterized protein n=1 Tax=Orchesella dallaii TaxID=48710 RepID=A0ABP1S2P7_9HEXA